MNKPQDPEAAETVQTTSALAVDLPRLVRHVLLLASYCGNDNDECSHELPCDDCIRMCNVVEIDDSAIEIKRIQGQFNHMREDRILNLPNPQDQPR